MFVFCLFDDVIINSETRVDVMISDRVWDRLKEEERKIEKSA